MGGGSFNSSILLQFIFEFNREKIYETWSTFAEVTVKKQNWCTVFETLCTLIFIGARSWRC